METKFTEVLHRTAVLEEIIGGYLAERVLRSWSEDFVDEDTGDVVTIQRNEILFDKGLKIDSHLLSEINFYLQSGDIKDVLVSNQKRSGTVVSYDTSVYCATIRQGTKKRNYYLYANSVTLALAIISDFLEQKLDGSFCFVAIKEVGYSILIPDDEKDDEIEKDFYKIEVEIAYEGDDSYEQTYVLQASDAEDAKEVIVRYVSLKMKEAGKENPFETTIISARTIPCNNIVDYSFVKEYLENKL